MKLGGKCDGVGWEQNLNEACEESTWAIYIICVHMYIWVLQRTNKIWVSKTSMKKECSSSFLGRGIWLSCITPLRFAEWGIQAWVQTWMSGAVMFYSVCYENELFLPALSSKDSSFPCRSTVHFPLRLFTMDCSTAALDSCRCGDTLGEARIILFHRMFMKRHSSRGGICKVALS